MIPLGALGQIYLVCATIGVGFMALSFFMGQLGHTGDGGGLGQGFDADGSGVPAGHDFGDDGGAGHHVDAAGQEGSTDHHLVHSSSTSSATHGTSHPVGIKFGGQTIAQVPAILPLHHRIANTIGGTIFSFLSPMSLAITLAFFGLTGLALGFITPWLGVLTIVPAIIAGLMVSALFKLLLRWMIRNMEVSTAAKINELVGQTAKVNIPIGGGRLGEVTYVVGSKRYNSAAQPAKSGMSFQRGAKVMIVEVKDHVVSVEPVTDFLLDSSEVDRGS